MFSGVALPRPLVGVRCPRPGHGIGYVADRPRQVVKRPSDPPARQMRRRSGRRPWRRQAGRLRATAPADPHHRGCLPGGRLGRERSSARRKDPLRSRQLPAASWPVAGFQGARSRPFVEKPMASDIARSRFGRPVGRLRRSSYGPVTSLSAARGPRPDTSVRPVTRGPIAIPDWHCRLPFPIRDLLRRGHSISDNRP